MSMQTHIAELHDFWSQLQSFHASESEQALEFAMHYLCERIGAVQAYWIGAVHFPSDSEKHLWGWRPISVRYLHDHEERMKIATQHMENFERGKADVSTIEKFRDAGNYRVMIQSKIVPKDWMKGDFYDKFFKSLGVYDLLCVATPVSTDTEGWLVFERQDSQNPYFNEVEAEYLSLACAPLTHFHKETMLHQGVGMAEKPLTKSETRVLKHLLKEQSEPEIAKATNLSPSTVHTYATRIYRKYGVSGRQGLMALWLSF